METLVLTIHILIALGLVITVLLQRSEGGGLGIGGGGGGGGGFMTARGTANMGPQYSAAYLNQDPVSARKAAVEKAYTETPNRDARRGRALAEQIGERLSQKSSDISKLFIEK